MADKEGIASVEGPSGHKGGMLKLKIAKKAYVFEVKKKYSVQRNFALKKKAETPAEDIKEKLREIFSKKKPLKEEQQQGASKLPVQGGPKGGTLIKSMAIALVLVLIAAAAFVGFFLIGIKIVPPSGEKPTIFSGSYNFSVEDAQVVSVLDKDASARAAYILVRYSSANVSAINITSNVYSSRPTTQVFLLDYEREGADSYAAFRKTLISGVREAGIPINEIEMERLFSLPSGALLVVPTGYLPRELAGIDSPFDFQTLLDRGVSIVYIGFQFDRTVLGKNGLTESVMLDKITFTKTKGASKDGFRLYDPQYTTGVPRGKSLAGVGQIYGSVSAISSGPGTMLLLPQTIDGGWRGDGAAAGEDVVRLIQEQRWLKPLASSNYTGEISYLKPRGRNETGPPDGKKTLSIFTGPFSPDVAFGQVAFTAADQEGDLRRSISVLRLEKKSKGEMAPRDTKTVPYYLSGQRTRLNIELKEDSPKPVKLFIRLYKEGALLQEEELELGLTNPTTSKPKDMQVNAEPGKYIVTVEDETGKVYASTELEVIGLDIEQNETGFSFQTKKFTFFLSANGQSVTPRQISVSLDGKGEKRYFPSSFTFTPTQTILVYEYLGDISLGNHTFRFTAGNWTKVYPVEYRQTRQFWDNPLVLLLGFLALAIAGVGAMLRRPEQMRYGLDIPDFLPVSTTKIPIKRETVLEIFESVNAGYSWQWMPLRLDEIKGGFRQLTYNGKPILIGDFNLERILARMQGEGTVKGELSYFGLSRWEKESGHPISYLAIYRIMRNVFVNNAVKFSRMDAMKECDIKAIAGKEEIYLHIMQEPADMVVKRALATSKLGTTIIVFRGESERDEFKSSLTSTSKLAVALKMEVNNGNIFLFPVKNAISAYLKGVVR